MHVEGSVDAGRQHLGCFFFSSRRRHTRCSRDWSSDVCSSDLPKDVLSSRSSPSLPGRAKSLSRAPPDLFFPKVELAAAEVSRLTVPATRKTPTDRKSVV